MPHRLLALILALAMQTVAPVLTLTGTVVDAAGKPVDGVVAVVFPSDQSEWSNAASRGLLARVPVAAGRFDVSLPAGSYKFAVVNSSQLTDWPATETLARLAKRGTFPLQLTPGQPARIDVEIAGSGEDIHTTRIALSTQQIVRPGVNSLAPPGRGQPPGPPPSTAPGSIVGRVLDTDGRGIAGVEVRSVRRVFSGGAMILGNFGPAVATDAEGRYQLANRQAADYFVVALTHPSPILAGASAVQQPPADANGVRLGYVTTFFGDTPDEQSAVPVSVTKVAQTGVDIHLARRRMFTLSGTIQMRSPAPFGRGVMVTIARLEDSGAPSTIEYQRVSASPDGAFHVDDVWDGEYEVSFSSADGWAKSRVHVAGRTPDPIQITPRPPMVVRGRVEFQGSTAPPDLTRNGPQFGIELVPARLTIGTSFTRVPVRDGTFSAAGTGDGPFLLRGTLPAPWFQVAGFVNGIDTLDLPVPAGSDVDGAVVVFADRPTALRVTVTDAQGQAVPDAGVIIFHEDPRYWSTQSRRVQTGTTLPGGMCTFSGLPPGRYFAATTPLAQGPIGEQAALIASLKPDATPFEMTAGQNGSVQLKVKR
jgi:hypothetical protein